MREQRINPKVILVGAGPGEVDLITVKALKVIKSADVILYDALVNTEILEYVNERTVCIYVGKKFNQHQYEQEEINQMLVDYALQYDTVVRLKGGDPYIFGRGAEEVSYLENYGIHVEIIPGISSALAVPAMQGIPLTKRNVNESFWVVTGTVSDGTISKDIGFAAQSTATIVILMGLRNFSSIMSEIQKHKHPFTPFAIIQNGTLPNENIIIETINNYKSVIGTIDYFSPGIIVIGDVVAEHPSFLEEEIQRVLKMSF